MNEVYLTMHEFTGNLHLRALIENKEWDTTGTFVYSFVLHILYLLLLGHLWTAQDMAF